MTLLILSFVAALADWLAVGFEARWLEYFAKPATLLFLSLWFYARMPTASPLMGWIFLIGLVFSLIGDIFLMLPGDWFLHGLFAFLLAHLAYIVGFNTEGIFFLTGMILPLVLILSVSIPIALRLLRGIRESGSDSLAIPVAAYIVVISLMVLAASTTIFRQEWTSTAAAMATAGALLFYVSDAFLGWTRFIQPLARGDLIIISTYHLAQYCIATGVLWRLGSFQA